MQIFDSLRLKALEHLARSQMWESRHPSSSCLSPEGSLASSGPHAGPGLSSLVPMSPLKVKNSWKGIRSSNFQWHLSFVPAGETGYFWPGGEEGLRSHLGSGCRQAQSTQSYWVGVSRVVLRVCSVRSPGGDSNLVEFEEMWPKDCDTVGCCCGRAGSALSSEA